MPAAYWYASRIRSQIPAIHSLCLFRPVCWAGELRQVDIAKGDTQPRFPRIEIKPISSSNSRQQELFFKGSAKPVLYQKLPILLPSQR